MLTLDLFEKWTEKYKKSIDCSHPKGFSQKAHCAGRKKHNEGVEHGDPLFIQALRDFLPVALKVLDLDHVPKIVLKKELHNTNVPTFGRFTNEEKVVYCVINNRHPNDILRTLAHEMVHYAQGENHELSAGSWHTGSPIENEAHEKAGVIMRHFNTKFPKYLKAAPIVLPDDKVEENFADGKKPGRKGLAKRSGVDCGQSVTKLRDIASHSSGEKQRMAHWCANMMAGKK